MHHRDVVQRAVAAGAQEVRGAGRGARRQPASPDGEAWRLALAGHPGAPLLVAQAGAGRHQPLQRGPVRGDHHGVGADRTGVGLHHDALTGVGDLVGAAAGADLGPQAAEVAPQRLPQRGVEVVIGDVEEQPLGGTDEVGVEHGHQLAAGEHAGVGEEAAGKDLQRQVAGAVREAQPVQHVGGADAVQIGVGLRETDVQQAHRGVQVHLGQRLDREAGRAGYEAHQVERRGARDAGEGVPGPVFQHQRVVVHGTQRGQRRIGPPQQGAQLVVLAEEGVEAAAHRRGPVPHLHRPGAHAAAQLLLALQQGDLDPALGQLGGRGQSGDAAAHHHDAAARHPGAAAGAGMSLGAGVAAGAPGGRVAPGTKQAESERAGQHGTHADETIGLGSITGTPVPVQEDP